MAADTEDTGGKRAPDGKVLERGAFNTHKLRFLINLQLFFLRFNMDFYPFIVVIID